MLNCRLVVDVGSDFDSLNFAPFRLLYTECLQILHACLHARVFLPLIANASFISIKCFVGKAFC